MIVLQLPAVKRNKIERPCECPYCEGETFQRWGQQTRRIKDHTIKHNYMHASKEFDDSNDITVVENALPMLELIVKAFIR